MAYLDLKSSQNMARLPSVMFIYCIETMLGSCFIFKNCNTHNGLIFDPNGVLRAPKTSTVTPIAGLSWPEIEPEHGRTAFSHVYILYRDYVGLLFHYQQWQHAQWTDIWPKWGAQSPQNQHGNTYCRPVVTSNRARTCLNCLQSCLSQVIFEPCLFPHPH